MLFVRKKMPKVALLNIATNKYVQFLNTIYSSAIKHFCTDSDLDLFLFSNHKVDVGIEDPRVGFKLSEIEHEPWPAPTLKRYHYFLKEEKELLKYDHLFYVDVDSAFVSDVKTEDVASDLMMTIHPLIRDDRSKFTYETNPKSSAYIPEGEGDHYFCGGFQGGTPESFLQMAKTISDMVDKDAKSGITPIWHDESCLNKYATERPPTKVIRWCQSDQAPNEDSKLLFLTKDHGFFRN